MIPRKRRRVFLGISIVLMLLAFFSIIGYLYLKTDFLKTKENLFAKYLIQNFQNMDFLKVENNFEIEELLNNNKYTSQIEGAIDYTENMGTSNEKHDSQINNVRIKIDSNIDKTNKYDYKQISIKKENEKLVGLEYLNQDEMYGIRLDGIKQFVSVEDNEENDTDENTKKYNIKEFTNKIDVNSILNLTEEEKQTLLNTYIGIIQSNISSDKYYKQSNALITVNNQDIKTNAYYMKIKLEEYNNLYVKILEQITKDDIILSKIDALENQIKEKYPSYNQDETLREKTINLINDKINEIQNNNIGNDEVKIVVYENNMKTVRVSIEKMIEKYTIDIYNNSVMKIGYKKLGDNTEEQIIKIEKTETDNELNVLAEYEQIQNNEKINKIQFDYYQTFEKERLNKKIDLSISNEKYKGVFEIEDNIKVVEEFENQIELDKDNVKLDTLQEEQKDIIKKILLENIQEQFSNLFSVVSLEDYNSMLQNLKLVKRKSENITDNEIVTDIERKRFNSQFEFFVSENLTSDNIKELLSTVKNNLEDVKILTKDASIQNFDSDKLSSEQESSDYIKNISEILIYIKQNSNNVEKEKEITDFIKNNNNNKYTVSIEYDNNGLTRIIRVKIQDKE